MTIRHVAGAPAEAYDADVVILSLDRVADTAAAVRSALDQCGVSRHVFIVDQASQPDALAQLAALVADRNDVTLVALDRNHGVAGGRNIGSALGHGRIIFGLDNDAEFADRTTLARAVATLDADTTLAAIGCRILLHATGDDDMSSWGYPLGLLPRAGESFDAVTFVGAGHAIRRTAWTGYDAALHFCWEELDYCLHAIEQGWRIRYCGDIVVRHKVSAERRMQWNGNRWFYFVRNRLYIARKWSTGWLPLVPRCAFYLLRGMRNGLPRQTLRALAAAVRMSRGLPAHTPSPAMRQYLRINDTVHRTRAWREAWHLFPGQYAPSRSCSSSGKMAELSTR